MELSVYVRVDPACNQVCQMEGMRKKVTRKSMVKQQQKQKQEEEEEEEEEEEDEEGEVDEVDEEAGEE